MFDPITNPYIVGNPIKTKKMFYGREDDFEFIRRKLESGSKSYIIVLSGERRSGKTSILFQILNGQLGDSFIPILIDMQTMAGLKNESEFFEKFSQETVKYLDDRFSLDDYPFHQKDQNPYKLFSSLLDKIHITFPDKNILFLIDEYELIEVKSEEGSLSQNFVPFLSGVLESDRHISFIFTGSRTLEERGTSYWQNLFGKSLFRNVSFLSEQDTMRLITQPVEGKITFEPAALNKIYRLTSGQPFYTQIVGQNIVDFVNETEKTFIDKNDLDKILNEILENPLPQMIYFWNSLPPGQMLILSLLAEVLDDPENNLSASEIIKLAKKKKLGLSLDSHLINTVLEALYHQKYVSKTGNEYCFQIDMMRLWIQRDHSIWRVMKEVDIESIVQDERPSSMTEIPESGVHPIGAQKKRMIAIVVSLFIIVVFAVWWLLPTLKTDRPEVTETAVADKIDSTGVLSQQSEQVKPLPYQPPEISEKKSSQIPVPEKSVRTQVNGTKTVASKPITNEEAKVKTAGDTEIAGPRNLMLSSKQIALDAQAPALASESFRKGQKTEETAEDFVTQKQYPAAAQKFQEAKNLYDFARTESQSAMKIEQAKYLTIEQRLQNMKKDLKAEHKSLQEYQRAEDLQIKGKQFADQGNYNLAFNNYSEAISLYQSVVQKRLEHTEKIQKAIKGYASSLEKKELKNSVYIKSGYRTELQNQWQPFFDVADDIRIDVNIHEIAFERHSAQVIVDVTMSYSGAGGSGNSNRWKFEVLEDNSNWVIAKINEAN